jgi:TetR/AcrR family transcriptional repressor of nem operon
VRIAAFFWIGWEGAVLRAKLVASPEPLDIFADGFFAGLSH